MTTPAPGTEAPRRLRPRIRWELIGCGLHGHELVGTDAASVGPEDAVVVREDAAGFRWHRCLRCDAWLPLAVPTAPVAARPPERSAIEVPLRGKPLRDRYVLRLIAVEKSLHVLVLGALAVAVFVFAAHRDALHHEYTTVLADLQGSLGGPVGTSHSGVVADLDKLFRLSETDLYLAGVALAAYAGLQALEMAGLWWAKRWAEYLTLIETGLLVPFEVYELTSTVSVFKVLALVVNLAIVVYLLLVHRLFGLRGGGRAERALDRHDQGWEAVEAATPPVLAAAASPTVSAGERPGPG